ncbi:MAG: dihydroneopterin aldolase [Candidatus Omnitrophota bacterium]
MATIHIRDLKLRAIIGVNNWERNIKQDVLINISLDYNADRAVASDRLEDALDYKSLKKRIVALVEGSDFHLLERLTAEILDLTMADPLTRSATVRVDKCHALHYADSVAVELSRTKE